VKYKNHADRKFTKKHEEVNHLVDDRNFGSFFHYSPLNIGISEFDVEEKKASDLSMPLYFLP
jgi:hypothetical protein